jgi:hypothetical protein
MTTNTNHDIEKLEADLWEAADNLRANSKLTSSDYFMPVLGVIFLRHAANRFEAAGKQIEEDQAAGQMPMRKVQPADYLRRRALWLPEAARYNVIMQQAATSGIDLPTLVTEAMKAIEKEFEPLQGVLPKDYGIFEPKVLEDLMRLFNSEGIKQATGDVFGRIYEYFLAEFSMQKAHDNGEFFTPASLVVAQHLTVVRFACKENGGSDLLLLVCSQAKPGGLSWTPPSYSAPIWSAPPEAKPARAIFASTRARTSGSSARRAIRRSRLQKARRCIACGPRPRR